MSWPFCRSPKVLIYAVWDTTSAWGSERLINPLYFLEDSNVQRVLRASGTEAIITTTQVPLSVKTGQEGGKNSLLFPE